MDSKIIFNLTEITNFFKNDIKCKIIAERIIYNGDYN